MLPLGLLPVMPPFRYSRLPLGALTYRRLFRACLCKGHGAAQGARLREIGSAKAVRKRAGLWLQPLCPLLAVCALVGLVHPAVGNAQDSGQNRGQDSAQFPSQPATGSVALEPPAHVLGTASLGQTLRLTRDRDLGQGRLGPRFVDIRGTYLLAVLEGVQHGPTLQLSVGISEDGGFYEPVDAFSQWVIAPGYGLAWYEFEDWPMFAHVTLPFEPTDGSAVGVEFTLAAAYRVLAGVGPFAEFGAGTFFGMEGAPHPLLSFELGWMIDYEVLP